ncbi:MAG: phage protease [Alsobacter sp.]
MKLTEITCTEIALGADGKAPSEFRILVAGMNPTRKGLVILDEDGVTSVMNEFRAGGVDLPIDYNHAMALGAPIADQAAAGWFKPEIRAGELWATDVDWTPRGRMAVESKEWRYTSLWGEMEPIKGDKPALRLRRLQNVGLVNRPATLGTLPLVAGEGDEQRDNEMSEKKDRSPLVVTLGAQDETEAIAKATDIQATLSDVSIVLGVVGSDAVRGAIRALKIKADSADGLNAKVAELEAKAVNGERDALVKTLSESGQLPPALHEWARTQPIESLKVFGEHAPKLVADKAPSSPSTEPVILSDELKKALAVQGMSEADYLKTKADMKSAGLE